MLNPPLSQAEIQRLERYSVESQREKFSDAELWSWITELAEENFAIIGQLPMCAKRAATNLRYRRKQTALADRLKSNEEMMQLIAWHLSKRGDERVIGWLETIKSLAIRVNIRAQCAVGKMHLV